MNDKKYILICSDGRHDQGHIATLESGKSAGSMGEIEDYMRIWSYNYTIVEAVEVESVNEPSREHVELTSTLTKSPVLIRVVETFIGVGMPLIGIILFVCLGVALTKV